MNSNHYGALYTDISSFVENECARISDINNTTLDEDEIPLEIQDIVQKEVNNRFKEKVNRITKDLVIVRIYELQIEWKVNQLKRVSRFMGDIPKYSIGTEINKNITNNNSLISNGGTSLYYLMNDVYNLPTIVLKDGEKLEKNSNDVHLLEEYNNVKSSLIQQCDAIRIGEQKLEESNEKADKIRTLEDAIKKTYGDDCSLSEYMPQFFDKLNKDLDDMRDVLEQLIKTSNASEEKLQIIQEILNNF